MKIGICGYGFVGQQLEKLFKEHHEVVIYDPAKGFDDKFKINQCDLVCISVPTQPCEDGSCDTSIIEEVVSWVEPLMLIKSAVIPGTTDRLKKKYNRRIVVSPEYAGESKYDNTYEYFHKDMSKIPWVVLGGNEADMEEVYRILLPIVGPEKQWHFLTAREAELVKYFENTFFAHKVAIVNEFYEITKALDCDWKRVREAWLADPRISRMHTAVFSERGFGGKCFPKDTKALCKKCIDVGYKPKILEAMIEFNEEIING